MKLAPVFIVIVCPGIGSSVITGDGGNDRALLDKFEDEFNAGSDSRATKRGDNGPWHMYDNWFDEYVLPVIVDQSLLSPEDVKKYEQKPVTIADWEPSFVALRNLDQNKNVYEPC